MQNQNGMQPSYTVALAIFNGHPDIFLP